MKQRKKELNDQLIDKVKKDDYGKTPKEINKTHLEKAQEKAQQAPKKKQKVSFIDKLKSMEIKSILIIALLKITLWTKV